MAGIQTNPLLGTASFNPYSAGSKTYNGVAKSPTRGAVDKTGYADRDRRLKAKRNAVLGKMQAMNVGAYANPNAARFM